MSDDLIKRSDAIGAITNHCENECYYRVDNWCPQCQREEFQEAIKAVLSAETPQWIPSKTQIETQNSNENSNEDCISREWLINRFKDKVEHYEMRIRRAKRYGKKTTYDTSEQIGYWKDEIADYKYIIGEIEGAPSVIPKPKEGEWILECDAEGEGDNLYRCPECGQRCGCQEYDLPNYCGNCGAKMKGVINDRSDKA